MRKSWLLCVLMGTLAWGQAAPAGAPPQPPQAPMAGAKTAAPDTAASVPDDAAVITINGVCTAQPKTTGAKTAAGKAGSAGEKSTAAKTATDDCKTVITKAQFERIANAIAPNTTPQQKKQLAGVLPRLMAMSTEAKKQGLDKTPQFDETVKFVKMQVLTNQLQRKIQEQAANISDAEMEQYYKENPQAFEQYNVDRIFVPRTKQVQAEANEGEDEEKMTDEQKKAKEDAEKQKTEAAEQSMTKLADDLRTRAAAGEDMAKLQKEAFDAAGMKIESPTVNLPNIRRTGLPAGHTAVFDLKPGEVSQVISDTGGHYIYKMNSKTEIPFEQAKNEIHSKMQNERMREKMEQLNSSFKVDTNEAYFGPGGVGPMPPPRMPRPRPGMPPAGPSGQPNGTAPAPQKN
ncbi:MAG TPA: peptidyl-prolyl cis-trans isomerase [Candidatus Sulfotelmatobacter sp.]|nr:peptidyl-prolyl cis-trans isomerase [Candidatus Sulfotelmatobacter sp.]